MPKELKPLPLEKMCPKCSTVKAIGDFYFKGKWWSCYCKKCVIDQAKNYYWKHKQKCNDYASDYAVGYYIFRREYHRRYREKNREKVRAYMQAYYQKNKERIKALNKERIKIRKAA